jgi:hypothetical protein
MKNYFRMIAYVVIFLFAVSACKSELGLDDNLKFSKLSVEKQKQKIEDNSIAFIEKMEGVKDTKAYSALESFMNKGDAFSSAQMGPMKSAMDSKKVKVLSNMNKQMLDVVADDAEIWGQYEWNFDDEKFIKINDLNNKLIMKFPSSESSKTNNAIFTLEYSASDVKMPDSVEFFPSDMSCELLIDGNSEMKAAFSSKYDSDGTPIESSSTLELEDYKWSEKSANNNKKLTFSFELSYKKEKLISISSTINGDLQLDKLEESESPDEVFEKGFFNFQIMNLGIFGGIKDVAAFVSEITEFEDSEIDYESKEYTDGTVDIINKHMIMYAYFVDENKKFADVEFYTFITTDTYYDWEYVSGQWVEYEQTDEYYEMKPRLILSDGSKVDFEEYFNEGFDELIKKLEDTTGDIPNNN